VKYCIGDIMCDAEQSRSLAHSETQPRHLPVLSVHAHRQRRHRFQSTLPIARASGRDFLKERTYLNG
jgi:hypothetical protein